MCRGSGTQWIEEIECSDRQANRGLYAVNGCSGTDGWTSFVLQDILSAEQQGAEEGGAVSSPRP